MPQFILNRDDLNFLLEQVTIGIDYSQLTNALDPRGLREVSGSNNNLVGSSVGNPGPFVPGPYTTIGQADQDFLRLSLTSYNPTGPDAAYATLGNGSSGNVSDATPRLVSNLVSTMFTTGDYTNPAAVQAMEDFYPEGTPPTVSSDVAFMPTAGVLGGGRYNAWFVAFGQFFDHGLDFVEKGASGTITIEIKADDPLYVDPFLPDGVTANPDYVPGVSNVMRVSRADLANPDSDFVSGDGTGALNPGVTPVYKNNTGLLIDQSQTYGSDESVNAFLREYSATGTPTGRLVTGSGDANGDLVTDGLATWADVKANALKIGIVLTDQDIYDAPMLKVDATGKLLFTPDPSDTWDTTTPFMGADPNDPFMRNPDGTVMHTNQAFLIDINPAANPNFAFDGPGYDAALLNAHYITGDGRANENFMLTAVHHVFHEEHNFQVENIKAGILATADAAFIAQWQTAPGVWDGEKLFQAARLITESEYNHIAVDQYVGTLYGALPEFVSYSSDINMGVSLEFSQAVFRLGHSMLTETFQVIDQDTGAVTNVPLLQAFLNPTAFADLGPAAITAGMVRTYGNEVDEFVTPALQQSLLGQPLDLASINIARGRDVGLPTHNELRQQIYDGLLQYTNNSPNSSALAPYTSWQDYGDHLRHPGTLVNMIAAYARGGDAFGDAIVAARDAYLNASGTLDAIRDAAQAVVDAYALEDPAAVTFMQGTPAYNESTGEWEFTGGDQGFWDVDLWIGGLAERPLFDGPLGTTFSYVLLDFAQRQQDGDRFYYLYRTPMGTHLGDEIIANHFTDLVMRATGLEHLNGDVFITPDAVYELDGTTLTNVDANSDINDFFDASTQTITYVDGTQGPASGAHLIIAGNEGHDYIKGGLGDDTIYGDDGNDTIEGSQGNDHIYGGAGDDFITDDENDDFIRGGDGNDRIFAGGGALDTLFGDAGDDELHGGDGIDELMGGEGDDALFGDGDTDVLFGEDGNDYFEGGDSVDEMWGGAGNDWMRGGVGDDHLNGGDGNDLLEGGIGPAANDGDRMMGQGGVEFGVNAIPDTGFDVVSYEDVNIAITANLDNSNQNGTGALIDSYAQIEGMVGSRFNDNLTGAGPAGLGANGPDNLLVGGAGNDILIGLGGDDTLVGDSVVVNNNLRPDGRAYTTVTQWGESRPDFDGAGPEPLGHILGDNGAAGNDTLNGGDGNDTANYNGAAAGVTVSLALAGAQNTGGAGTDTLISIENLTGSRFDDVLTGNGGANVLNGGLGNDALNGAGGTDTASYADASGGVSASLTSGTATGAAGNDTLSNIENLLGSAFNDTLTGNGGVNVLTGGDGDDVLDGSTGADTMIGGAGNDTYFVDDSTGPTQDVVTEGVDAGIDLVNSSVTYTLAANVENLTLIGAAGINGTGNGLNNVITGNTGNNALTGGAGNDTLIGGLGNDTLNGGTGDDTFAYTIGDGVDTRNGGDDFDTLNVVGTAAANTLGAVYNGTVLASVAGGAVTGVESITADLLGGDDTLSYAGTLAANGVTVDLASGTASGFTSIAGVENVTGGSGNDTLTGDGNANVLNGGANGGADTLTGGGGNDTLIGGGGNDALNGGTGDDTFTYTIGDGADTVDGGADFDTLNVTGTAAANTLGAVYNGTVLASVAGAAVTGVEAITADLLGGVDTLSYAGTLAGNGVAVDLAAGTASGFTSIAGVENVTGGSGNDTLIGDGNANVLNGGANGGADTLTGGGGADTLIGGNGDDTFIATIGDGNDSYNGGANTDTYDLSATTAAAAVDLGTGSASSAQTGINTLSSIENVIGSQSGDVIDGNTGINTLDGGAGADTINAGNGADVLIGGLGNDTMNGGVGNDRFVFAAAFDDDTIMGFDANPTAGQDLLDIAALGINAGNFGTSVTITDMVGVDTLVTIGADTITLVGVNSSTVTMNDFLLA